MPKGIAFKAQLIILSVLLAYLNSIVTAKKDSKFSITLENFKNVQYIGSVFAGSDLQEMKTIFSTGTGLTWLIGNTCTECRNTTHKFDSTSSTSYRSLSDDMTYDFATGKISGQLSSETITLKQESDIKGSIEDFKFLLLEKENLKFNEIKASGIIGLGIAESNSEYSNFVTELHKQGVISSPKFGFYLSSSDQINSKIFFGDFSFGTLLSPYYKLMEYCQVASDESKWSCDITRVEINKNKREITSKFVIDTATSYLYLPLADFKIIKKFYVDGAKTECVKNEINQLICKCKDPSIFPDIILHINNDMLTIKSRDIIDYFPEMSYQCRFELIIDESNDDTWTLGTAALKNTLFTFDLQSRKIGFLQFSEEVKKLMIKDNLIIQEPDENDTKIVYIFVIFFILVILGALVRFANSPNFIPRKRSDSFDFENVEDKKTVELIKNRFNDEEYDYDGDIKNISNKHEISEKNVIDNKFSDRIELKELKENKEV